MAKIKPIPDGHNSVSPYLIVDGAARALDFYKKAFGATELYRLTAPDGKVGHAEVRIGDTLVMLADEHPDFGAHGPGHYKGSPISLHLYVEDVDTVVQRASAAGARVTRPVADQFYGDRRGTFEDPFGHTWHVASHVEDVSAEEIKRRAARAMQERKGSA
jgi:PhnB protein